MKLALMADKCKQESFYIKDGKTFIDKEGLIFKFIS